MQLQAEGSFNSMKVRLKPSNSNSERLSIRFQFHEGPIKTFRFHALVALFSVFQFHEGPIKTIS